MKICLLFIASFAYCQCNSLSGSLAATGSSAQVQNTVGQCANWAVAITTTPPVFSYTANLQGNFGSGFVNIGNTCNTIASCNIVYSGAVPNQVQLNLSAFSSGVQGLVNYNITGANPTPAPAGGGVIVAAPYVTVSGTKYVAATMWPFTPFFSGTFLDANTSTFTAGANGSEFVACPCNAVNSWYGEAATTSVEAEFQFIASATVNTSAGIWMCDTTNGKLYSWELTVNNSPVVYQLTSWTLASCAGTPSAPSVIFTADAGSNGIAHFQLLKSGSNLLARVSQDGGQTYLQFSSQAVGTLSKGGIDLRGSSLNTAFATYLSVVVQ